MPKTGTSHIQNLLWNNPEALEKQGYSYPHLKTFPGIGRGRNGYFLRNQLKDENGKRNIALEEEIYRENFDRISELAGEYENIIISEEGIWSLSNFPWVKYKSELERRNLDCKIIVYLRRQDLFIESYWAQKVKEKSTLTFEEYISKRKYRKLRLDYCTRLNEIARVMGKENITVRVYEKGQYIGKTADLTSDFFEAVGLELTDDFVFPEKINNPSLNGIYVELKRRLNFNPVYKEQKSFVVPLLYQTMEENSDLSGFTSGKYFTKSAQHKFLSEFDEENASVAKEYLNRPDGLLFYDSVENEKNDAEDYSTGELIDTCGKVIDIQHRNYEEQIAELKEIIKRQQSTINWISASFPKKVTRKLKRMIFPPKQQPAEEQEEETEQS